MQTIPPVLVKTWLDTYYLFRHNNKKLGEVALKKIYLHFGSKDLAQVYIDECQNTKYKPTD